MSSAWLDITADVLHNPSPKVAGIGITGNSIMDRIGDTGTYTFSLNNSTTNIGGVLGYYTPAGANVLSGWTTGIPIRLTLAYDGYQKLYYFVIDSDGIEVVPFQYKERRVNVRCSNWLDRAAKHRLKNVSYQTTVRGDQGIQAILDDMTFKPQRAALSQGQQSYPTMFDITHSNTMAISEINKIVMSGLDYAYISGDDTYGETLRYMTRTDWLNKNSVAVFPAKNSDFTDSILTEAGDHILSEAGDRILIEHATTANFLSTQNNMTTLKVLYGKNIANRVKMRTYPRRVDTTDVVLWSLETPITIAAGETLTDVVGQYTNPSFGKIQISGINMVIPVSGTDFKMYANIDATGTDRTADLVVSADYRSTAEVKYSLTNNNAATSYITTLQARGRGVYIDDPSEKLYESSTSQTTYGVIPLDIDLPYLDGLDNLFVYAEKTPATIYNGGLLTQLDKSMMTIEQLSFIVNASSKLMLAFLFMDPGDALEIYETVTYDGNTGYSYWNSPWWLMGYDFEIINGKYIKWSMILKYRGLT